MSNATSLQFGIGIALGVAMAVATAGESQSASARSAALTGGGTIGLIREVYPVTLRMQ